MSASQACAAVSECETAGDESTRYSDGSEPLLERLHPVMTDSPNLLIDKEVTIALTKKDFKMCHSPDSVQFPESIYGAAMMAIIRSSQTYHGVMHCVSACIAGVLAVNILVQFYVLACTKWYICAPAVAAVRRLYATYHDEVFHEGHFNIDNWQDFGNADELCQLPLSQPLFFLTILSIWTGTCWVELLDSFRYFYLWASLPGPSDGQVTQVDVDGDDVILSGASRSTKAVAICAIIVPKFCIVVFVWWLGSRWLVATTSLQDLLLNAMALAFITELDEMIFMCLIPDDIKAMVQTFKIASPPVIVRSQQAGLTHEHAELLTFIDIRDRRLAFMIGRMAVTTAVVVGFPVIYMMFLQQVLLGYRWDVHHACALRFADGEW